MCHPPATASHRSFGTFTARASSAQSDAELRFEALERQTERWLLAPQRAPGAADSTSLGNLMKRLQEIPIDLAREVLRGWEHERAPLVDGLAIESRIFVCCASEGHREAGACRRKEAA